MKCGSCGYEHEGHWTNNGYKATMGDENFIAIYTEHPLKVNNTEERKDWDDCYEEHLKATLHACPKCKTVVLNIHD